MLWDIFCRVIDNFGDIGVCWRLCADLAARGHQVRLWVDDASALRWMAPGALEGHHAGIAVHPWDRSADPAFLSQLPLAQVWVEAFGCEIAPEFIAARAHSTRAYRQNSCIPPVWINLEYLSAEGYVERCHGLPSPVLRGPAQGWTKHFFYPGFTPATGGLLREPRLLERQRAFAAQPRTDWLAGLNVGAVGPLPGERWVSLFCYEPSPLPDWLSALTLDPVPTRMLVCAGRASTAVRAALPALSGHAASSNASTVTAGNLTLHFLPYLSQEGYDELLWACDLNCVRGEDSLVRDLWAGKPLLWHIYPQDDGAQWPKLDAFLDWLGADATLREAHHHWNGSGRMAPLTQLNAWASTSLRAREKLLQMDDLTTQLLGFIAKKQ